MSEVTIAYRYTKPLLDLALEKGIAEEVNNDMELLRDACDANFELKAVLRNPVIRGYKKLSILKAIFRDKVQPLTLSLFDVIDRRNREEILYTLSVEFIHLYKIHKGIEEVTIISATPLTESARQELITKLSAQLGKQVELIERVDESLIGGMMIKVGDTLLDNSIRASLKRLEINFLKSI